MEHPITIQLTGRQAELLWLMVDEAAQKAISKPEIISPDSRLFNDLITLRDKFKTIVDIINEHNKNITDGTMDGQ